jgi:hypothetical protein
MPDFRLRILMIRTFFLAYLETDDLAVGEIEETLLDC